MNEAIKIIIFVKDELINPLTIKKILPMIKCKLNKDITFDTNLNLIAFNNGVYNLNIMEFKKTMETIEIMILIY